MLAAILSFYGLSNKDGNLAEAAAGTADERTEDADVTDAELEANADLSMAGGSGDDRKRWIGLHRDIMRASLVDNTRARTSLLGAVLSKMPKGAMWFALAMIMVVLLVLFIPLVMALVAVWKADTTVKVKISMHGLFTFLIFLAAFVVPISVA